MELHQSAWVYDLFPATWAGLDLLLFCVLLIGPSRYRWILSVNRVSSLRRNDSTIDWWLQNKSLKNHAPGDGWNSRSKVDLKHQLWNSTKLLLDMKYNQLHMLPNDRWKKKPLWRKLVSTCVATPFFDTWWVRMNYSKNMSWWQNKTFENNMTHIGQYNMLKITT